MIDSGAMPSNKKKASHSDQESSYAVGDHVKVSLHTGRIVDATVKAIVDTTDSVRLQVSLGDGTARTYLWQFVEVPSLTVPR
jgi:hypothetical protein